MSVREIGLRVRDAARHARWTRRGDWVSPTPDPNLLPVGVDTWVLPPTSQHPSDLRDLIALAAALRRGRTEILGIPVRAEGRCQSWHTDPQTGRRAPLTFGPTLDYRDASKVGNVRNTWGMSRHQHLSLLAHATHLEQTNNYAEFIFEQLESWIAQNPVPLGVNWSSPLELGLRLISWLWIERLLRGTAVHNSLFGPEGQLIDMIYWHQWFIHHKYAYGTSANNHLVGEAAGVFVASLHWSAWAESLDWHARARRILEAEIIRQTFPSGLNREQAFGYHLFALEFFLLAAIEADRARAPMSPRYIEYLRKMLRVIPAVSDRNGNIPRYGDSDEGLAFVLGSPRERVDTLYDLGRRWLGEPLPDVPPPAAGRVLWPQAISTELAAYSHPEGSMAFHDAGFYVLASDRGLATEILCTADAGPLGFLSVAAHGHCDALHFTLNVGGQPIVVDPGTYTYHADPDARDYFRGTAAHNTIRIGREEQSVPGGPFLYLSQAVCRVAEWAPSEDGAHLKAEHGGYARLPGRVVHRRHLELSRSTLFVWDTVEGVGMETIEWHLHFHPDVDAIIEADTCEARWSAGCLRVALDSQLEWSLLRGEPDGGWYSPTFNVRRPTFTLRGYATIALPAELRQRIQIEHFATAQ